MILAHLQGSSSSFLVDSPAGGFMAPPVRKIAKDLMARLPEGNLGLACKIVIGLVLSAWWNSGKGKEEAM